MGKATQDLEASLRAWLHSTEDSQLRGDAEAILQFPGGSSFSFSGGLKTGLPVLYCSTLRLLELLSTQNLPREVAESIFHNLVSSCCLEVMELHRGCQPGVFQRAVEMALSCLPSQPRQGSKNAAIPDFLHLVSIVDAASISTCNPVVVISLFQNLASDSNPVTSQPLFILSHVCRASPKLKGELQGQACAGAVYKRLLGLVSHPTDQAMSVGALCMLAAMLIDHQSGMKVFTVENVQHMGQLVFGHVVDQNMSATVALEAVGLMRMLLGDQRCARVLAGPGGLSDHLAKLFENATQNPTPQVLDLILAISGSTPAFYNMVMTSLDHTSPSTISSLASSLLAQTQRGAQTHPHRAIRALQTLTLLSGTRHVPAVTEQMATCHWLDHIQTMVTLHPDLCITPTCLDKSELAPTQVDPSRSYGDGQGRDCMQPVSASISAAHYTLCLHTAHLLLTVCNMLPRAMDHMHTVTHHLQGPHPPRTVSEPQLAERARLAVDVYMRMASAHREQQSKTESTTKTLTTNDEENSGWKKLEQARVAGLELELELAAVKIEELQAQLRAKETVSRDMVELRQRFDAQAERLQGALGKLVTQNGLQQRMARENAELQDRHTALKESYGRLLGEAGQLRAQQDRARRDLEARDHKLAAMSSDIRDLQQQLSQSQAECRQAHSDRAHTEERLNSANQQLATTQELAANLQQELLASQTAHKTTAEKLAETQAQLSSTRQQHQQTSDLAERQSRDLHELTAIRAQLEAKVNEICGALEQQQRLGAGLQATLTDRNERLASSEKLIEEQQQSLARTNEEKTNLSRTVAQLRLQLEEHTKITQMIYSLSARGLPGAPIPPGPHDEGVEPSI